MTERTHFENLMGDFLSLVYQTEADPSKELILKKAAAFMEVMNYVKSLEYTIQKIKRAVGEE